MNSGNFIFLTCEGYSDIFVVESKQHAWDFIKAKPLWGLKIISKYNFNHKITKYIKSGKPSIFRMTPIRTINLDKIILMAELTKVILYTTNNKYIKPKMYERKIEPNEVNPYRNIFIWYQYKKSP